MDTASDQPRREDGLGRRQLLGAAAALVAAPALVAVAVAVASGAPSRQDATPDASPEATPAGTPSAGTVTIEAFDFGFDPVQVTVAIGDTVELFSSGQAPHNFILEGYEDEVVDYPEDGSTVEWTLPDAIEPGTYVFYCSVGSHRAQGMEGEITIIG